MCKDGRSTTSVFTRTTNQQNDLNLGNYFDIKNTLNLINKFKEL